MPLAEFQKEELEVGTKFPPQDCGHGGARPQTKAFAAQTAALTGESKSSVNQYRAIGDVPTTAATTTKPRVSPLRLTTLDSNSLMGTTGKWQIVPPFVPPFSFVPPLWIPFALVAASFFNQRSIVKKWARVASWGRFSFCWYFCWYFWPWCGCFHWEVRFLVEDSHHQNGNRIAQIAASPTPFGR